MVEWGGLFEYAAIILYLCEQRKLYQSQLQGGHLFYEGHRILRFAARAELKCTRASFDSVAKV